MTIILTGGGTGGHVIPALALLPELKEHFNRIIYIGGNGIEKKLAKAEGLEYYETQNIGLNRKSVTKNLKIPYVLLKGINRATKIIKKIKPDVIFSKGGYVSLPTVIAARSLHIPVVSHESDLSLGLANKIAFKFGATILTSFLKTTTENQKYIYTGFPLRKQLFKGDSSRAKTMLSIKSPKPVVLIVGGSSGSKSINNAVLEALPTLIKNNIIIHITGKDKKINFLNPDYFNVDYISNIEDFYALADVVVSRAGAGAISELAALEKSAVLIPLPKGNSRGDQIQNANFAFNYGAVVLPQENLNAKTLIESIEEAKKTAMRPFSHIANKLIANILYGIAVKNKSNLAH